MPILAPHRKTPNREREQRERVWALVAERLRGHRICDRCGATFSTFDDKCDAEIGASCPGANVIEATRRSVGQAQ
ncbi:MAG: hypothetical protein J0H17_00280 [Rhizobiales bacterium]|nr:hypothetical protein [Hyphomicrobiales bacterium]